MTQVGIEALNLFGGVAKFDLQLLAAARNLDHDRFANLLMLEKSVVLPYEDPVSYAVNAAKPLVDALTTQEKDRIELLIVCSESGIDFSKSISSYVHRYLNLSRNCRMFELKQACYTGTAGLQMAINFILANTSPGAKALVITSDISRFLFKDEANVAAEDWSYAEPSAGSGAVALLVSDQPKLFQVDVGCNGYYGYEVLDQARPAPDSEFVATDISLLSYMDCCENAYRHYETRVEDVDYQESFGYLAFHMPFGGMVKGTHRSMMRKFKRGKPDEIETDFKQRVLPGLRYGQLTGNLMGGSLFCSLASVIDHGDFRSPQRIGMYSYGSGCCSEFFSGVVPPQAQAQLAARQIASHLANRYALSIDQYEQLFQSNRSVAFGTRNVTLDYDTIPEIRQRIQGSGLLMLHSINEYYRQYEWV